MKQDGGTSRLEEDSWQVYGRGLNDLASANARLSPLSSQTLLQLRTW